MAHLIRIFTIAIVLLAGMFFPFLPGDYDGMAITLSFMIQFFGFAGTLLVLIGLVWLSVSRKKTSDQSAKPHYRNYGFGMAAFIGLCMVVVMVSLPGIAGDHRSFGLIFLSLSSYMLWKYFPRIRQMKDEDQDKLHPLPYYLVTLPVVVLLFRILGLDMAVEYSRKRVIHNSLPLIEAIETYHQRTGHYPLSLLSLWNDISPGVVGVKEYHYEPYGQAYNLFFHQFAADLPTQEIVMYNPLDEQVMTSHKLDLLEYSGEQLNMHRGYYAVHELDIPHWKYFWFD